MDRSLSDSPSPTRGGSLDALREFSSERARTTRESERNLLLSMLSDEAYASLEPDLEPVSVVARQIAWRPEGRIHAVYFPRTAVFSLLTPLQNHSPVESATVGHEGVVGVPVILDAVVSHTMAVVQIEGDAARVDAARFRAWLDDKDEQTQSIFLRYVHVLLEQTAQSVACNRKHALEKRCARWLLATRDRVGSNAFALTHEFLAAMLGVRRASVTVALGLLQQEGFLRYSRGRLRILDDRGLESTSCECYRVVRAEQERVLRPPPAFGERSPN